MVILLTSEQHCNVLQCVTMSAVFCYGWWSLHPTRVFYTLDLLLDSMSQLTRRLGWLVKWQSSPGVIIHHLGLASQTISLVGWPRLFFTLPLLLAGGCVSPAVAAGLHVTYATRRAQMGTK